MSRKLQFKRGNETNLPLLDVAEPAVTLDSQKMFYGTSQGNVEVAKKSDLNVTNANVSANAASLSDIVTINNHTVTYVYNADGTVQSTTEKDASNNVIKTVTYTYNAAGDVATSVTVMNGKTVTTTYNYDASGNITSTSNVLS